ncbi:MAG: T9SS type A sorting domain-containing protein [Bacteroidales bacterium]|nr:T9SS type A sorting domain-containing protein [Bacteroidota bacterium]MBL6950494.1 T9SS type A sorting domain-containing protein [Bacteroidales bacterium]
MKTYTTFISALLLLAVSMVVNIASATVHTILVGNFYFNPSVITDVQVGDTIKWQWVEGSHTTTSTTIPAGAASWDSPITSGNQVFEYKVTVSGSYDYKCTPHSSIQTGSFTAVSIPLFLVVTPDNQQVTFPAGTTTFDVESNTDWIAISDRTWCTVTPSGSGNGTIVATFEENPSATPRTAWINISGIGTMNDLVSVSQDGSSVGVDSKEEISFRIYPNPTSGVFNLVPGQVPDINMELFVLDLTGKTLHSERLSGNTSYRLDISSFPEGVYFVRMNDGETSVTKRVVKSN